MYIVFRSFHRRHTIKNCVWDELKRYVRYNTDEENFNKLKTRFFLRLRNRGFRKYVLAKLFQHVTYSLRNKLLSTELPPPNACRPLTIQKAEKRIFLEGKAAFALSQEDEATFGPPTSLLNTTNKILSNNTIAQENSMRPGHHLGTTSTKGSETFKLPVSFILKILQGKCCIFLQFEFISLFRIPTEAKDKAEMLFSPPGLYAKNRKVNGLFIKEICSKVC